MGNKQADLFPSDPRPTFLFWARGGPVALMRGANRPLLTRLVEQEVGDRAPVVKQRPLYQITLAHSRNFQVEVEVSDSPRDASLEIDFRSHKVIQCQGELAALGDDEESNKEALVHVQ